ncbi:MAG: HesA/MoeB/ThiF family protein [Prevotella sp.]
MTRLNNMRDEELRRYSRHILLKEIGKEGQERLAEGRVLIIGCGGLGSPIAMYLAAAGVGTIGLMDGDVVDESNLQRQIIHFTPDVGKPKVASAAEKLRSINPYCRIIEIPEFFTASPIITDYDFIIDGTDRYHTKYLINDVCVKQGKPYSHGGVLRYSGNAFTYVPGHACYRCIFGDEPSQEDIPTSSQVGILGTVAGMIGIIQATETIKYLTKTGELLTDALLTIDAMTWETHRINVAPLPSCGLCQSLSINHR